jgi:acyl-CoA synthetase (AMP-forming)/AMP-acid ligase II
LGQIVIFTSKLKSEIIGKIVANNKKPNLKFVGILDGSYDNFITFNDLLKEGQNKTLDRIPYFNVNPKEDLVFLLQSSGTSGVPKSVMISQRSFVANMLTMIKSDFNRDQTPKEQQYFCHMTPVACMSGIATLIGYIALGVCVVTYREYNPELFLRSIEKYKIALCSFVPTFAHLLLNGDLADKYKFSSV